METIIIISLMLLALIALAAILNAQNKILKALKSIRIPEPQKIEFPKIEFPKIEIPKIEIPKAEPPKVELPKIELPKIEFPEFPKIEIPPAKEFTLDLNPVIEAINNSASEIKKLREAESKAESKAEPSEASGIASILQETAALMRVNQAEFQSGLEAFHKAIDKLLAQIPSGEKELNAQKELMQKFEEAMGKAQEAASEAMSENSLRLQEILAEVLNKEQKG